MANRIFLKSVLFILFVCFQTFLHAIDFDKEQFIGKLYKIGAIKCGDFTLKSGKHSSIYIDLRTIISYPEILKIVSNGVKEKITADYDVICGVPYGAIPIATALSLLATKPLIMHRKEIKNYGTQKMVEGVFNKNNICLVIEDVVTSGESLLSSIKLLQSQGLIISDVICIVDREQNATQKFANCGVTLHSLCTLSDIINMLKKN